MKLPKIVFMGTPTFASNILESLILKYPACLVVCQPDKEKDRKGNVLFSPVKKVALENNIKVVQPKRIRKEYQEIVEAKPDIIITCAYGQILPKEILDLPRLGCINVHASLLPKLRGGAPIHHALIEGFDQTGVTIMYMDEKMDNGDIISQKSMMISEEEYLDSLYEKLSFLGRDLLLETLPSIIEGTNPRMKQKEEEVTFGYNITKEEEKIDFSKTSKEIYNLIRGLNSDPGAYTMLNEKRMKIYQVKILNHTYEEALDGEIVAIEKDGFIVKTKDGALKILEMQLEGKKRSLTKDYLNGIGKKSLLGIILK